jgi:hypothetical protein
VKKPKRRSDPNASDRMKAYWKAKREKEALVIEPEEIVEGIISKDLTLAVGLENDPPWDTSHVTVVEIPHPKLTFAPEPEILTPSERETFDSLMAQIKAAPHNGAKEAIIDQNRTVILSGMNKGWK